ncbi:hypothetical protein CC2G_003749 [Coprinopsis cinerea AmutBmut pab1-1]|nr:hypothetical protein CC2G_003749 [Coprinopsis cinerea AmutBmut pab1-1]
MKYRRRSQDPSHPSSTSIISLNVSVPGDTVSSSHDYQPSSLTDTFLTNDTLLPRT